MNKNIFCMYVILLIYIITCGIVYAFNNTWYCIRVCVYIIFFLFFLCICERLKYDPWPTLPIKKESFLLNKYNNDINNYISYNYIKSDLNIY